MLTLCCESTFFRERQSASENASRTPGACFLHGAHIPYRRSLFLVPSPQRENASRITGGPFLHRMPPGHQTSPIRIPPTPPPGTKKEIPTECYFNRDFRKAAAAYSPTWWGSTIGASELNFSVRYGKRWILTAITAAVFYLREISWSEVLAYSKDLGLLVQVD